MKKLTLLFTAVFAFAVFSFAQADYTMFKVVYIKPDYTKLEELGKAMTKYNKTWNSSADHRSHIWVVNSGPHTGEWLYVHGPTTFTNLDNRNITDDQRDHWMYEVMPNVEKLSDAGYWRMSDKHTYEGTIEFKQWAKWTSDFSYFHGGFVLQNGTGELENLHGHGTFYWTTDNPPALVPYLLVHFAPA